MRWSWMIAALLLTLAGLSPIRADIAPRQPTPPKPDVWAKLVVEIDPNAKEARLLLPRKIVVGQAEPFAPGEDGLADAGDDKQRGWPRTVMAGLSLALATSCAGLWLVRRGKINGMRLGLLLAVGVMAGGGAALWANISPPGPRPRPQPPALQQIYSGKLAVEYVAQGEAFKLILPPSGAKKLASPADKPVGPQAPVSPPKPNSLEKPD